MDTLLLKDLSEASLTEFNSLHHAFSGLNRSLPAHAQVGDAEALGCNGALTTPACKFVSSLLLIRCKAVGNDV
eukprot:6174191-Pleurochrysis_carterae.AAC.1